MQPSKNHPFLVVVAGFAGNHHQKIEISGRPGALWASPQTLHRVSRVINGLGQAHTLEVDMRKVLQALVDTFRLAAGSVELGSTAASPADSSREMRRHATAKQLPERGRPGDRAGRSEPQAFVAEPALRASAEKSQP